MMKKKVMRSKGFALAAGPSHPRREQGCSALQPIHKGIKTTRFKDFSPQAAAILHEPGHWTP
ncbi:hypothetical protein ACVBEJ_08610 [Porticoccus sp. GXU_MW_L64]